MIFRSELLEQKRISVKVEHDHRQISRIIATLWNELAEEQKDEWRKKADHEKILHKQKHPDYRYTPVARAQRPLRRKTKRNTESDRIRCREVADLLKQGKSVGDLEQAVQQLDVEHGRDPLTKDPSPPATSESWRLSPLHSEPPFKDPLLPPSPPPTGRPHRLITHVRIFVSLLVLSGSLTCLLGSARPIILLEPVHIVLLSSILFSAFIRGVRP